MVISFELASIKSVMITMMIAIVKSITYPIAPVASFFFVIRPPYCFAVVWRWIVIVVG